MLVLLLYSLMLVLAAGALIALQVWIANHICRVAALKGHPGQDYFWISFWFPVIGAILVAGLPERQEEKKPISPAEGDAPRAIPVSFSKEERDRLDVMEKELDRADKINRIKKISAAVAGLTMVVVAIIWCVFYT